MWWQTLLGVLGGLLLVYVVLVGLLFRAQRAHPEAPGLRESLRLVPDLIRLLRRLASDRSLPRGVRLRLLFLVGYLASPVDLIPDFIPVIGFADDAIVVAAVLRSVTRRAGPEAIERHWTGTPEGLQVIRRFAGLSR